MLLSISDRIVDTSLGYSQLKHTSIQLDFLQALSHLDMWPYAGYQSPIHPISRHGC